MKEKERKLTYISLFSSAGVGCYGFLMENYNCVATNELIPRRLDIQRFNHKCKYDSGYICGDITTETTKELLRTEFSKWKKEEKINDLDILIATPPCQGMSVANHKKTDHEIFRNSLVVDSIKLIVEFSPIVFIFENVPAFMKTICTDTDGTDKPIAESIRNNLGKKYSYSFRVINFKDYGACSSRSRTLVIGVRKDYADEISPYDLFPERITEKTLKSVIGDLKPLNVMGEIDESDIYHAFRTYPEYMRQWIHDLHEGESAFDNDDILKRPHQVINGKIVENARKNGDKYTRQFWDKVGPCVHTRNDQLASQNTIHPQDDRVFSIRELMRMMSIPESFKWSQYSLKELNEFSNEKKKQFLKREEIKIRQSLGEAVPTIIFNSIARNYKKAISQNTLSSKEIDALLTSVELNTFEHLLQYLTDNPDNLSVSTLMRIAELANTKRTDNAAYYTNKSIITEILNRIPDEPSEKITILEPSVGVGNFLPLLFKKFDSQKVQLDIVDIDAKSLVVLKAILKQINIPYWFSINIINDDFLLYNFQLPKKYDYIIGNPPFGKVASSSKLLKTYKEKARNKGTSNICSFFLDKSAELASHVALIFPKAVLNAPEFSISREYLSTRKIDAILDFGENGFKGVLVETIALVFSPGDKPKNTTVFSMTKNKEWNQTSSYIFDSSLPYWIIYRNSEFDTVLNKLELNVFTVFRDRQITNNLLLPSGKIPVIKSRNINDTGSEIISISGYDSFVEDSIQTSKLEVFKYINADNVYMTPNMTYNPRVMKKPHGTLVNGSVALLFPKNNIVPTESQLLYFSSREYRNFYSVARNFQTRSLNVDSCSVYFFGLKRRTDAVDK